MTYVQAVVEDCDILVVFFVALAVAVALLTEIMRSLFIFRPTATEL